MKRNLHLTALLLAVHSWVSLQAAIALRFDAPAYTPATNEVFSVTILVDGDDQAAGVQPVPNSLFSFGLRLEFPAASATIAPGGVRVVPALDYTGLIPGAVVEQGPGFLLVRGNIAFSSGTTEPYRDSTLLTVQLRNLAPLRARYGLTLISGRTAQSGDVMADGLGQPLDAAITFGRSEVVVTPKAPLAPPHLVIRHLASNSLELTYSPTPGLDHFVQGSTDTRRWTDLFPVPRNDGRVLFENARPAQFFRLRTAPVSP